MAFQIEDIIEEISIITIEDIQKIEQNIMLITSEELFLLFAGWSPSPLRTYTVIYMVRASVYTLFSKIKELVSADELLTIQILHSFILLEDPRALNELLGKRVTTYLKNSYSNLGKGYILPK